MLRRARSLVSYWEDERLLVENYATAGRVSADPLALEILHFFSGWRSVDALLAHLRDYEPTSLRRVVAALEHHTLLERSHQPADTRAVAMEQWGPWNPAAGFFHLSTKNVRFSPNHAALDRYFVHKAARTPLPPAVKR